MREQLIKSSARSLGLLFFICIFAFAAGIALGQAGVTLAGDVIEIVLWTIGAAVALSFGLGGRDVAGKQLEKWLTRK